MAKSKKETCINCGKRITKLQKFLRIFYAPIGCNTSFVYKITCSRKCWKNALEKMINELECDTNGKE
jgi:hypothetical protein